MNTYSVRDNDMASIKIRVNSDATGDYINQFKAYYNGAQEEDIT